MEGSAFDGTCISEISLAGTVKSVSKKAFLGTKLCGIVVPKGFPELGSKSFR